MLIALTELDAINLMLSSIGSDPVSDLDETDVDVANAKRILEDTSRNIQRQGWDFNTVSYTLQPNRDNKIKWIDTIISHKSGDGKVYVKRGDSLFNLTENTFYFKNKIVLTAIIAVDFEDLPDCFKRYIAALAAFQFAQRYFGDQTTVETLQYDVQMAHQQIVAYDMNMGNYNMLQLTNIAEVLERT